MQSTCPNPTCQAVNRWSARFCRVCGGEIAAAGSSTAGRTCAHCGTANPAAARYCHQCAKSFATTFGPPGRTGRLVPLTVLAGRYRIVQMIGQGGMGAVYRAEDERLGRRPLAIKELSDAAITNPLERRKAHEQFRREAEMLAKTVDHPRVPRVTDLFQHDDKQFLVMDFVDGQTLAQVLGANAGQPLNEGKVVRWSIEICEVLEYLHAHSIIFRDLKPSNIMIDRQGEIRLVDFGIARVFAPGKARDTIIIGTAGYASPEHYGNVQTDARSDVYSLGATMHHLLTGRDPTTVRSPHDFPTTQSLNPKVSGAVSDIVDRALAVKASERWPNARSMRAALEAVPSGRPDPPAGGESATGAAAPPADNAARPGDQARQPGCHVTVLVLAVIGLIVLVVLATH